MRKTKIICTLGPSSSSIAMIRKLLQAGMNTARINFSHGTHEEQKMKIDNFKKARDSEGIPAALLLDTRGPEIRLKTFVHGSVSIEGGQRFTLCCGTDVSGSEKQVSVNYEDLYRYVKAGDIILIDDGKIKMQVESVLGKDINCNVLNGGRISDKKGVNVPGVSLEMDYLSDSDKADILLGIENDIDYVAASFVRRGADVRKLRNFLAEHDASQVKIIAKIENEEGIRNFDEILKMSDGIMIARGDMGVELDFKMIPGLQKKIISTCRTAGKLVITATQMLESMIENPTPTRAEITDVANAVYDGTSAVMLSAETAVGSFPIETVKTMGGILNQAEKDMLDDKTDNIRYRYEKHDVSDAVGHAACQAAEDLQVKAIIAVTQSGYTAEKISKYRPTMPILAATPSKKTYYQQALTRGIYPMLTSTTEQWKLLMEESIKQAKASGFVNKGNQIVICAGMPLQETGKTNLMRIEEVIE